ncbi:MAG: winged helix-turn-helix transcriptional regulator [Methanobacteriota archaeon]
MKGEKKGKGAPCEEVKGGCAVADLFRILGKPYMLDMLHIFIHEEPGPRRFVDLQRRLSLSPNTLSDRLKELVEAGLLSRTAFNEIPPRVDYEATRKAHDLKPVFEVLLDWAAKHDLQAAPVGSEKATV